MYLLCFFLFHHRLAEGGKPKILEESSEEEEDEETPEEKGTNSIRNSKKVFLQIIDFIEKRRAFEAKRKGHYREWHAVQLARKQLLEQDEDEDDNEDREQDEDEENTTDEENQCNPSFKCMPSCDKKKKKSAN